MYVPRIALRKKMSLKANGITSDVLITKQAPTSMSMTKKVPVMKIPGVEI